MQLKLYRFNASNEGSPRVLTCYKYIFHILLLHNALLLYLELCAGNTLLHVMSQSYKSTSNNPVESMQYVLRLSLLIPCLHELLCLNINCFEFDPWNHCIYIISLH